MTFACRRWVSSCADPTDFLNTGPSKTSATADVVHSDQYDYFSCEKPTDFGMIVTDGAVAISQPTPERVVVNEVIKPRSLSLRLGELPGTSQNQRALQAWAIQTRNRRLELTFPDFRQPTDFRGKLGNRVELRPTETRETLRYEILLSPGDNR